MAAKKGKGVTRVSRFTRVLLICIAICLLVSLVLLRSLESWDAHASSSSTTAAAAAEGGISKPTPNAQPRRSVKSGKHAPGHGKMLRPAGTEAMDDDGTLVPIRDIPPSPYYAFDPRTMPRAFLRTLQNSSRRINKNWIRSKFNRYDTADISDCDVVTPECGLHKYLIRRNGGDPNARPYRKCCVEHKALLETTVWVVRELKSANITYFLSTGSALGVRRHAGSIIPWDTDVDISVYPDDEKKVERLFRNNGKHYFRRDRMGRPMFWVYHSRNGNPRTGPHVEIFYDPVYTRFPHLLLPLEDCVFYCEPVKCPNIKQFQEWFPSGWTVYSGGHYDSPEKCIIYENGMRRVTKRC
ncbi:hypothetical protein MOQ_003728 [Trypanosoma cruzi marinkellei]|uniref:LicD/FKTN/FKRP nucleotidyltransferase domain-containing protein n=1 Tax=Trypanosoma cruzi marinkellei TaxID=85056 RepID=K2N3B1_TRYCR|nr:hypothetical protein MOQ_003728 [Trypanosoma cruzi marinkellei]